MVVFLEEDHTINDAYYAEELKQLREEIMKERRGVLLLQDNAPAHTPQAAMAAATKWYLEVLPSPPSPPTPAFFRFRPLQLLSVSILKTNLRGRNLEVMKA